MSDNAAGATIAAPTPCTAPHAISTPMLSASPPARDEIEKTTRPRTSIRRRPKRSPIRPPRTRRPPKVIAYAVITHWTDGRAGVELALDRCQGDVHDAEVQDDHEQRRRGSERAPRRDAPPRLHGRGATPGRGSPLLPRRGCAAKRGARPGPNARRPEGSATSAVLSAVGSTDLLPLGILNDTFRFIIRSVRSTHACEWYSRPAL